MDVFLGMIAWFGFNFAPRGWMFCNGQLLPISQNSALFSLLGTNFGGDGVSTFALPDLRGRLPLHQFQGPGLSSYVVGQQTGTESVSLSTSQMPSHNHVVNSNGTVGGKVYPGVTHFLGPSPGDKLYASSANVTMSPNMIGATGGSQPFSILNPSLTLNACIAIQGIFPSRN